MFNDTVKKNIKIGVWIVLLVIFQTTVCRYIAIGGIMPDVMLVFVMSFVVLEKKFLYCTAVPIICGVLMDLLSARGFGTGILIYTYSALLCYAAGEHFFKERLAFAVPSVIAATFVGECLYFVTGFSLFDIMGLLKAVKDMILWITVYNTAVTFLIYPLLKKTVYGKVHFIKIPKRRN